MDCMSECHMMDLGFSGPKFTWTNKREVGGLIQCRLDRVWANLEWKATFPEATITHLTRVNSDHCPLLLSFSSNVSNASCRPFRFQPMWMSHNDFPAIVRESWNGMENDLMGADTRFTNKAQSWNKEIFGNIFARKKLLMARLLGAQRVIANSPSNFLINLQEQLSKEYNEILQLEEELWAMKSRVNWTIYEERNTAYFHLTTLARRRKNRINSIMNEEGEWVHNLDQVQGIFTNSFVKLYQTYQIVCPWVQNWDSNWCMKLEEEKASVMGRMPTNKEIWDALSSMKPYKALGCDGIHAGFYQRF